MQTFLPFPDLAWSARTLDQKRLGKQRVENYQLLLALLIGEGRAIHHPAAKMWAGYERALLAYQQAICDRWINEFGFKDTCWDKSRILFLDTVKNPAGTPMILPPWLGNVDFHISHQSNLLRKDETHYRPWFPGIKSDHEYIWPEKTRVPEFQRR